MRDGCDVGALNYIDTRRVETGRTEFLDALRVDERRQSLSRGHVVRSLQGRTQLFGRLNVSTLAAEGFCRLVVPKILLEQIHVQRARVVFGQWPHTPAVIVIDDADEWQPIFRGGLELHQRIGDRAIRADSEYRSTLVGALNSVAFLRRGGDSDAVIDLRADRAALIVRADTLAGPICPQVGGQKAQVGQSTPTMGRLPGVNSSGIEEVI